MDDNKFQPYIPADRVVPEFTVVSVILGVILAILFGGAASGLQFRLQFLRR